MGRRKKTQAEKDATKKGKVDDFTVDKESQLKVFTEKRSVVIPEETIKKFDIKPKGRISDLQGNRYLNLVGKTFEKAIEEAYNWMEQYNNKKDSPNTVKLVDYFAQIPLNDTSQSIIVSFVLTEKK